MAQISTSEFLDLIDQHQALVHKVCRIYTDNKEDHSDLFQEILLQLWKAYPRFKGNAKLTTWMYRVALYTAMSDFKKRNRKKEAMNALERSTERNAAESYFEMEYLHTVINRLNASDRALLALYLDELSYHHISEIMGISESNVGVRLNRIKKRLKNMMTT